MDKVNKKKKKTRAKNSRALRAKKRRKLRTNNQSRSLLQSLKKRSLAYESTRAMREVIKQITTYSRATRRVVDPDILPNKHLSLF